MLTPQHCDLFDRPFFQFAQFKKYCPDAVGQIKADYRSAWQDWRDTVLQVSENLGAPFAPPHIERWCNGWQVRAHFFAFFKYERHNRSAAILSLLLNRRRLTVSLDWHGYKAAQSPLPLAHYNRWLDNLDAARYADFDIWHGSSSEYADYPTVAEAAGKGALVLQSDQDFFCIGKHLCRDRLGQTDAAAWITRQVGALQPLYEACFDG